MKIETKQDILDILKMPYSVYLDEVAACAREIHRKVNDNILISTAMAHFPHFGRKPYDRQ